MSKVLHVLKVRHRDSTGVHENVGKAENTSLLQNLFSTGGRWSISRLAQDLALEVTSIRLGNCLFNRCWDKDVARLTEGFLEVAGELTTWVSFKGVVLSEVGLTFINVQTVGVVDATIEFDKACNLSAAILCAELGEVVPDVTNALDDKRFVLEAGG